MNEVCAAADRFADLLTQSSKISRQYGWRQEERSIAHILLLNVTSWASVAPIQVWRISSKEGILPAGLALVALSWATAWAGPEPIRWYTFFPLWLGYILAVDGLNYRRHDRYYLTVSPRQFAGMFVVSMPL